MREILIILGLFIFSYSSYSQKHNILVIHSYHKGFEWTDKETLGIESVFVNSKDSIELSFEYLDIKRYSNERIDLGGLAINYKRKYNGKIELIIVTDNKALNFIKQYRNTIAPNAPIVFCGINNFTDEMINGITNITGVIENIDYKKNIELILELHPTIDTIIIINDNKTFTAKEHKKIFLKSTYCFNNTVKFVYYEDFSFESIQRKTQNLSGNSAIFQRNRRSKK